MPAGLYRQSIINVLRMHATFPAVAVAHRITMTNGQLALQVGYLAPSPLGLLGSG
jgi:hypothetical protein